MLTVFCPTPAHKTGPKKSEMLTVFCPTPAHKAGPGKSQRIMKFWPGPAVNVPFMPNPFCPTLPYLCPQNRLRQATNEHQIYLKKIRQEVQPGDKHPIFDRQQHGPPLLLARGPRGTRDEQGAHDCRLCAQQSVHGSGGEGSPTPLTEGRVLQRGDVQGLGEAAQVAKPRWCIAVPGHHCCCRLADMVQENVAAIHRLPEGQVDTVAVCVSSHQYRLSQHLRLQIFQQAADPFPVDCVTVALSAQYQNTWPIHASTGNPARNITALYATTIPTEVPACRSRRPRNAMWLHPARIVRVYTNSCLLAARSVELSEANAKKANCSTCSPPAARMGRAMACAISRAAAWER